VHRDESKQKTRHKAPQTKSLPHFLALSDVISSRSAAEFSKFSHLVVATVGVGVLQMHYIR